MKIGIIGSGHVGSAIATGAARAGYEVRIASKHFEHAQEAAQRAGAMAVRTSREAAAGADMVILALPVSAVGEVATEIADLVPGKTVVDVTNPIKKDLSGLLSQRSVAQDLQDRLPGSHVVKAFNTVFAAHQSSGQLDGEPLDGFFAADDPGAKAQVAELLSRMGFRPLDVGPLPMARALEDMELLNMRLNATNNWQWQTEWKLVGPTA